MDGSYCHLQIKRSIRTSPKDTHNMQFIQLCFPAVLSSVSDSRCSEVWRSAAILRKNCGVDCGSSGLTSDRNRIRPVVKLFKNSWPSVNATLVGDCQILDIFKAVNVSIKLFCSPHH